MNKRIVIDVPEEKHRAISEYCRADGRTIRFVCLKAIAQYMSKNPVVKVGEYESTEK